MMSYDMETNQDEYHERNRCKVCIVCYRKGQRPISEIQAAAIGEYIIQGYNKCNQNFPCALCNGCHLLLTKRIASDDVTLPVIENYDPKRPKNLRSAEKCDCKICKVATANGLASLVEKRKRKANRGRPKICDDKHSSIAFLVCNTCFTKIYPGCRHQCSVNRKQRVYNIEKLMTSPKTSEILASRFIKRNVAKSELKTLGPSSLKIKQAAVKKKLFSVDDISAIQKDLQLSTRQTLTLAQDIRLVATCSRKSFDSGLKAKLQEKNHALDDLFEHRMLDYKILNKENKSEAMVAQHTIICTNLSSLVEKVINVRELDNETAMVRIGLDGGRGFIKVVLSIFELNTDKTRRISTLSKKFKNSGVKKAFIVAIVPEITENYFNMKRIWINVGMHLFFRKFTIATDLKLCNILLGLMSHSSCHPCCWCDIDHNNLDTKGTMRTIGNLQDLFWTFFKSKATKKDAKKYGNAVHPSLIEDNDQSKWILELIPPPELHLMLGPVNTMYNALEKECANSEEWLNACNVKRSEYHGGAFEGNDCRKLLKSVKSLKEICQNDRFSEAFEAFNDVVVSCYGAKLATDFEQKIDRFRHCYLKLNINITPKVHAVIFHVADFCNITGMGLGPWSEQCSESIHHDFSKVWENFKVKHTDNPEYGKRLLQAVCMYNSLHL